MARLTAYRSAHLAEFDQWLESANVTDIAAIESSFTRASAARNAWQRHIEYGEPTEKLVRGYE